MALLVAATLAGCGSEAVTNEADANGGSPAAQGGASAQGGAAAQGQGGTPAPPPPIEACVTAAVELPWTGDPSSSLTSADEFELFALGDRVALVRRKFGLPTQIRSYALDGTELGWVEVDEFARMTSAPGESILVMSVTSGALIGRMLGAELGDVTQVFWGTASETERVHGVLGTDSGTVVFTDERFVNTTTGASVAWTDVLAGEIGASPPSMYTRLYGMAAEGEQILLAWGASSTLARLVMNVSGVLVDYASDDNFFSYPGSENAIAALLDGGLVMLYGNPIETARMGFDMSLEPLGRNEDLRPFYRATPTLAIAPWNARPLGFWLAVNQDADPSQSFDMHEVWGCEIDLGAPQACVRRVLIAQVEFDGYRIGYEPLAATLVGANTVAIAHTDMSARSWLRFVDLSCALAR